MAEYLHLDKSEGVATITIDRPEVRNAVPGGGWDALHDLFDDVARDEEVRVLVDQVQMTALGLAPADVASALGRGDAKVAAGQLTGATSELQLEVTGELDSLDRIRQVPITRGADGRVVRLGDIAGVLRTAVEPPPEAALLDGVPGVAVARVHGGELAWSIGCGYADAESEEPVTGRTVFNIGSISKSVAAWGLMRLVESEEIELDAPVERYLTRWHLPESEFDSRGVTLRRLLSHTAGLSLHGYPGFEPGERLPVACIRELVEHDHPRARVREQVSHQVGADEARATRDEERVGRGHSGASASR